MHHHGASVQESDRRSEGVFKVVRPNSRSNPQQAFGALPHFRAEVDERKDVRPIVTVHSFISELTRDWKHVKTCFTPALGKPKMEEAISDLRELSSDFSLRAD